MSDTLKPESVIGCILGTAVGDALGLPAEGLSRIRQRRMFPDTNRYHFFFGRGMTSDDTAHTIMTAQALIASGGNVVMFKKSLARQLRWWLLTIPGGAGLATLKACIRLLVGISPDKSGVFSAGNGPAMRAAIIGVCYGHDIAKLRELVRASTRITHTDPKAEYASMAVALAAYGASRAGGKNIDPAEYYHALRGILGEKAAEFLDMVDAAALSAKADEHVETFAEELGMTNKGISGYIYYTVPVVLQTWFRYQNDYRSAIKEIIHCGGDTDTTAAILGGIIGASVGRKGIPREWQKGLMEWPKNADWMDTLGTRLAKSLTGETCPKPVPAFFPAVVLRNIFFLLIVLLHGFRRLLPPY